MRDGADEEARSGNALAAGWEALAEAAAASPASSAGAAVAALLRVAAPGAMRHRSPGEVGSDWTAEILDASGSFVWSEYDGCCHECDALELLEALLPGWKHLIDEDEEDGSAEAELHGPGDPGDPVRASGATIALALLAAACRAMARIEARRAASRRHLAPALDMLDGGRITAATVREMAFEWEDGFTWDDSRFPFVQAQVLELTLDGRGTVTFEIRWDDDITSLAGTAMASRLASGDAAFAPGWRDRVAPDFPLGSVDGIDWYADALGDVQEVTLRVAGRPVILRAGEVEPSGGRAAIIRDRDESVLIFLDRDAYVDTIFNVPVRA